MNKSLFSLIFLTTCFLFQSCGSDCNEGKLDTNKDVVRKYHEIWSNGRVAELDNILAKDFVCHFINDIEWKGIDGANNSITSHRKSFPDWNEEIVDMISEGDKVVTRYKSTGTHQGMFNGIDSTGKKVMIYETSIYQIANGKIAEQWGFPDALGLDSQVEGQK